MSVIKGDGGSPIDPRVAEIDRLRAELASRQIDIDTFREGNQKLRAELAAKDRIIANLNERSAQYERDSVAKDARIAALSTAFNRIANGTRFTSDETLRAIHKVTTEILGDAYEPFDVKMP